MPYIEDEDIAAAREVPFEATVPQQIPQQIPQRIPQPPPGVNGGLLGDLLARQQAQKDAQWAEEQAAYEKAVKQTKWMNAFRGLAALADGLQGKQTKYGIDSIIMPPAAPKRSIDNDIKIQDIGGDPYIMQGGLPVGRYSTPEMEKREKDAGDVRRLTGLLAGGGPPGWKGDRRTEGQIASRALELGANTKDLKEAMALNGEDALKFSRFPASLQPFLAQAKEENPEATTSDLLQRAYRLQDERKGAQSDQAAQAAADRTSATTTARAEALAKAFPNKHMTANESKGYYGFDGARLVPIQPGTTMGEAQKSGFQYMDSQQRTQVTRGLGVVNVLGEAWAVMERRAAEGTLPMPGVEERTIDGFNKWMEQLSQSDPELAALSASMRTLLPGMAREASEVGNLSTFDQAIHDAVLPNFYPKWDETGAKMPDTEAVIKAKIRDAVDKIAFLSPVGKEKVYEAFVLGYKKRRAGTSGAQDAIDAAKGTASRPDTSDRLKQLEEQGLPVPEVIKQLKKEGYL